MAAPDDKALWSWAVVPRPQFVGGNRVELLEGGDQLFPRMAEAIARAAQEVWLATYIFHDDSAGALVADALVAAAARGVAVYLVVDGFGSIGTIAHLRERFAGSGVQMEVFRPLDRWWAWLQPGQLRRLHQKLCVVDDVVAFVGGINVIDDRNDLHHGRTEAPRLDFAVELHGPLAPQVRHTARAMWARARLGHGWREELRGLMRSAAPAEQARELVRLLRARSRREGDANQQPMRAAFVVRDNLRQRRAIERSYIEAITKARHRVDIAVPYFYPGGAFRRALRNAARRGVRVRLLLQGKIDYRIAGLAARALYDELRGRGVRIYEYVPAFLHAKVALVDEDWATVGSSNIDPLSLLLNLEANVVVRDADFVNALAARFDIAVAVSQEVGSPPSRGLRGWLQRGLVAWAATVYLRLAGITGRY